MQSGDSEALGIALFYVTSNSFCACACFQKLFRGVNFVTARAILTTEGSAFKELY